MRLLHTSVNVNDMDESIEFYTEKLGLTLVSRLKIPENKAEIAFLEDGETSHRIELTHWRAKKEYIEGDQLDHIAFEVNDIDRTVSELRQKGVKIEKEPHTLSTSRSRISFVTDPNNIWIELIEHD
jgi:lactoylglutathione lyase